MEHMFYEAHNHILQKDIKNSYQNLDLITVLSVQDKLVYKNLFPNTEVLYLPNILDEKRNNFNKENLILAAGRLEFEKGFDILIQAINELQEDIRKHNYLIKLFGDGSEKQKLLKMTENYNIRDIFEIHPSTNNLGAYLSASKITCVPSRVEGFGMVILEAMNQKSVVVSFDIGYGPSSLISNNINGLLASQGDYIDLSNKLKLLIQNDSYINSLSNSALDSISNYSPDNIYKILSYYIN
ncbi:glycosyltransferase [Mammaliicoccus vitulinus]|uniref:glycosyltransferase n=1 Tax=Mammaliicoccus vitulinus TaxID=71237 RepID=UPI00145A2F4F|nr:glycosyltransferase [Mammaliicoccus vitulinus]QJF24699.1 glycosyltransferase family 4 protein [Mammaliicoccus vitulinus]